MNTLKRYCIPCKTFWVRAVKTWKCTQFKALSFMSNILQMIIFLSEYQIRRTTLIRNIFNSNNSLTLKEPEYLVGLKAGGGGGITPQQFSCSFIDDFHANQPKHHLKWKLASLSACRVFEHHSKLHSFAVRWRRSSLLWQRKFSSFRYYNFWKFVIFDLHGQYVHQMKAENILNANLTEKNTICEKIE